VGLDLRPLFHVSFNLIKFFQGGIDTILRRFYPSSSAGQ
jgi:hypothetical protein